MNSNFRVIYFVGVTFFIYFILSVITRFTEFQWKPFENVNLITDLIKDAPVLSDSVKKTSNQTKTVKLPKSNFELYKTGRLIIDFSTDTSQPSIQKFLSKLTDLKKNRKRKIRIAYIGDSMIEGDLISQTLRILFQQYFGGNGVGFIPITSQVSKFRQTVIHQYSSGWKDESFKSGNNDKLYLSGHMFRSSKDWVRITDQTIKDSGSILEKSLILGQTDGKINILVNESPVIVNGPGLVNRIPLTIDRNKSIKVSFLQSNIPIYGITVESPSGVFVDNFSFRGITGLEFGGLDSTFLRAIDENNPYDLIIFQYGVNLLFRPADKNFNWYAKSMLPVIRKLKNCFNNSNLLIVSVADRAFRYNGEYRSAVGIDSLIKVQATMAYETGCAFYNQFASMGGTNSIVEWANSKPSLANKDYIHPNHRGAELLGNLLFESIINEYEQYLKIIK